MGATGPAIRSHWLKARLEVVGDHAAQLLRLQVVGVVVAVREHVGADHDAALHLGAEAFAAARLVDVLQVGVVRGAMAVAARRRSATGSTTPRPARSGSTRESASSVRGRLTSTRRRAEASRIRPARRAAPLRRRRPAPRGKNSLATPMRRPCSGRAAVACVRPAQGACVVLRRPFGAGRVAVASKPLIADSSRAQSSAAARQRAGLVEARGEGDHAVARARAVGRLDAGDAAEARRLADRAAGVGAGRGRQQPRRDRGRASRPTSRPARGLSSQGLRTTLKAEFSLLEPIANSSQFSLAERHRAGLGEPGHHGRVEGAAVAREHARAGGGRQVAR